MAKKTPEAVKKPLKSDIKPDDTQIEHNADRVVKSSSKPKPPTKRRQGAQPGHKKTGGRKAGIPNKKSLVFRNQLAELGFDIAKEINELYHSTSDINAKLQLLNIVTRHSLPVMKPIDPNTGDTDNVLRIEYGGSKPLIEDNTSEIIDINKKE